MTVAALGAVLYMLLPYHFEINLWRRQDIGELANYIWMPLVLHYTERLLDSRRAVAGLGVSYALMLVSHLPSAFLFSLCLIAGALALGSIKSTLIRLPLFARAIAIGISLAAIYWVPALFTEEYVHMDFMWGEHYDFHRWLWPLNHRFDKDPVDAAFSMRLFIGIASFTFISCWLTSRPWQNPCIRRSAMACLIMTVIAWFLTSSWSTSVWETLPQLPKVQFPWRAACVLELTAAIAALQAGQALYDRRDMLAGAALFICIALLTWFFVTSDLQSLLEPYTDPTFVARRDYYVQHRVDATEYQTAWNPATNRLDSSETVGQPNRLGYDNKSGTVVVTQWRPRAIENASTAAETRGYHRTPVLLSWRATLKNGSNLVVTPSRMDGLIVIQLPAGTHDVRLELAPLPQEWIGAAMSLFGLLLLILSRASGMTVSIAERPPRIECSEK